MNQIDATSNMKIYPILITVFTLLFLPTIALCLEIEPFRTANRSPLVQIYGLPAETSASLVSPGGWQFSLTQDIASVYSSGSIANEKILLDGELYRWSLVGRYGLTENMELGLEIPFVLQGGGFLDGFIIDWHRWWGLPQGGRDTAPKNRLCYNYTKDGIQRLYMRRSSGGIGDISLLAAYSLYTNHDDNDQDSIAIRGQLKLPSGDSSYMLGSGGTDISMFLTGSMQRMTEWGNLGVYASGGGIYISDGDILSGQQENLAGFANAGLGWAPATWINFKVQCNFTTPFYKDSRLDELSKNSFFLVSGGTLKLPGDYLLDIGVGEDIAVATAPDVSFHLGLSKRF